MDLLGRLIRGAETRSTSGLSNPADWLINAFSGASTNSGERVTIKNAIGIITVFAVVADISETVGGLPLKVYRMVADVKTEAQDHRAWRMLHDQPNPLMNARSFWSTVASNRLLWGNAFLELERSDGVLVDTLWPLDPARVTVEWNEARKLKRFRYVEQSGEERVLTDEQVLHILDLSTDGIIGMSRIATCREGIGKALARDRFEAAFHRRGGTIRGVVEHPGRIKNTRPLRESWNEIYGGSANANQVAVLEEGATFKPVQMPLADMQFVESAKLSASEIATLYNAPASRYGGSTGDSLTYETVEGNAIQWATQTITPVATSIQEALEHDPAIFPFAAWWPEFDLKGLMRGDSKARSEYYKAMSEVEAIHPLEVRDEEGLGPWPAGEVPPWEQPELAPIEEAVNPTANGTPPSPVAARIIQAAGGSA
jgi:HK97 family phage portal protein